MKIYFAHPVSEYGTPFQAAVLKELASSWHEVENPDAPHHQEGYRQHGMAYFEGVIAGCDALAYLRFPDGSIGAGVAKEIAAAADWSLSAIATYGAGAFVLGFAVVGGFHG